MPSEAVAQTPIADTLRTLGTANDLPAKALRTAVARAGEAAPAVLAVLNRAAAGKMLDANESSLVFFGLHVLAAARVTQACAPLLRLLRRPDEEVEDLLGDAKTMTLPRIVASVFDGNADALLDTIANPKVNAFTRWSLFGAMTYLTWTNDIARDKAVDFLAHFLTERRADAGDEAWCGWLDAIGLLGLEHLAARAEQDWALFPENYISRSMLREMVADAAASPTDATRLERDRLGRIDDVVQSLEWISAASDPDRQQPPPPRPKSPPKLAGRNDPCPCGSGNKYKKCCIGKEIELSPVAASNPITWSTATPRPRSARR